MLKDFKLVKRANKQVPTMSKMPNDKGGTNWVISVRGCIECPDKYAPMCDVINNASDKDSVLIIINTPGGMVYTGLAICSAIKNCKAIVTTRAVGMVASCGALLWSVGHKLEVCKFSRIMFHASSGGWIGKTRDQKEYAESTEMLMKELSTIAVSKKILTADQLKDMFESRQDVYLNCNDLVKSGVEFNYA
jgi:ATP-dependent protease ClpP protease subunit